MRVWIGCDDVVDYGSGSYRVGEIVGEVHDTALGGRGKVGKVIKNAAEAAAEKGGRLGSQAHRDSARKIAQEYVDNKGGTLVSGGGGKEKRVETPGGRKKYRYPDAYVELIENGQLIKVYIQVVRYLKDGVTLPKREREAKEDLEATGPNVRVETVPVGY